MVSADFLPRLPSGEAVLLRIGLRVLSYGNSLSRDCASRGHTLQPQVRDGLVLRLDCADLHALPPQVMQQALPHHVAGLHKEHLRGVACLGRPALSHEGQKEYGVESVLMHRLRKTSPSREVLECLFTAKVHRQRLEMDQLVSSSQGDRGWGCGSP